MTDHHLFDDFVREKLADHKAPVPGGLWDKIEAATAAERTRKKGWARIPAAYRAAALLILCAGASALFFWPGSESSPVKPGTTQKETAGVKTDSHLSPAADSINFNNTTSPEPAGADNNAITSTDASAGGANTVAEPSANKSTVGTGTSAADKNAVTAGAGASAANKNAATAGNHSTNRSAATDAAATGKSNATAAAATAGTDASATNKNATTAGSRSTNRSAVATDAAATAKSNATAAATTAGKRAVTGTTVAQPSERTGSAEQTANNRRNQQKLNNTLAAADGSQGNRAATVDAAGNKLNQGWTTADKAQGAAGLSGEQMQGTATTFNFLPAEMISLKQLSASNNNNSLSKLLNSRSGMMPVIRCPVVRNNIPTDLYVEVYASPDMPVKQTSANYGGSNYLARKDSSQRLQTSFTAGIRVSKGLSENVFVKTGFQYSQINEHFNYRQENERKQVTVITTHTITRPQGDTVLRDTSTYEQIGYLQKRTHNKYKSIDIPVIFSYEWGNEQWRLAANVGAIVNLHSWYAGELLDTSFQAVSIRKDNNEVYKSNIGLGLYAGFSIIKPVGDRMDLFAEPYFRYNLSNMTKPGQSFNQRLHTAGLSLGIRYRLNGGQRF